MTEATPTIRDLDPSLALREGRTDAIVLLVLWCLRRAFLPLLFLGLAGAAIVLVLIRREDVLSVTDRLGEIDGVGDYVAALLSPFAGVVAAFLLRILVGIGAFAAAFPLSLRRTSHHYPDRRRTGRAFRLWWDRIYLTRAYRALRWTWVVRREAARRAGRAGSVLLACDPVLRWVSVVALVVFIGVLVAT